jgi:hypothetical protein
MQPSSVPQQPTASGGAIKVANVTALYSDKVTGSDNEH